MSVLFGDIKALNEKYPYLSRLNDDEAQKVRSQASNTINGMTAIGANIDEITKSNLTFAIYDLKEKEYKAQAEADERRRKEREPILAQGQIRPPDPASEPVQAAIANRTGKRQVRSGRMTRRGTSALSIGLELGGFGGTGSLAIPQ